MLILGLLFIFFFFNDTATTEIYTLSLHDALPISSAARSTINGRRATRSRPRSGPTGTAGCPAPRSEEHTSELQSRSDLVCRLLLEKKKKTNIGSSPITRATTKIARRYHIARWTLQ